MSKRTRCGDLHTTLSGIHYSCLRLEGHEGRHKNVGITWDTPEKKGPAYGVYEDAAGVLWKVTPDTKENAEKEAGLVGEGHRAVKVKLGRKLEQAFEAGRAYEMEGRQVNGTV